MTMKRFFSILAVVAALCAATLSCMKGSELDPVAAAPSEEIDNAPKGEVTIDFKLGLPEIEALLETKADTRDSIPNLQTLHVAVFGGSGYLKQYAEAELVQRPTVTDKENYYGPEDMFYTYRVTLWLTNSSIKVHFIGNGPGTLRFDYESSAIPELYKTVAETNSDAYWQRITIPRGIRAKTYTGPDKMDANGQVLREGDYINIDGNKITNGQGYIAADETVAAMRGVQLIRNFAQLSVESKDPADSYFELRSYSIVNEPNQGTIAPYNGEWLDYLSYIDNDNTHAYDDLLSVYKGLAFANTTYDSSYPDASAFTSNPLGANVIPARGVGYIYERPAPALNQPPTYLLVYGIYKKPGDTHYNQPCYYKIDLMDKGQYLTLFRNFRYKVTIKHVNKFGKTTPKAAAEGAGSGDVSADAEALTLTDISDGDCQLYVTEMRPILVEEYADYGYTGLMYKFVYNVSTLGGNDIGDDAVDNNYHATDQANTIDGQDNTGKHGGAGKPIAISFARVENGIVYPFEVGETGSGPVITRFHLDTLPQPAATSYYRTIHFTTKAPTGASKSETFRIKATYVTGSGDNQRTHTLYRDVVFTLLKTQQLSVTCIPDDVIQATGQKMTVRISIPASLPQAMFPLQFPIEIVNNSLGPDYTYATQNLPVTYGQTYQYTLNGEGKKVRGSKNGYYFVRTLSLDEYNTSVNPQTGNVEFDSYFVTTKAQSASEVYVGCLPPTGKTYSYFEPGKTAFTDYVMRDFTWITNYNVTGFWGTDTDVSLEFRMDTADIPLDQYGNPDVYVTLASTLRPADIGSNLGDTATPNRYKLSSIDANTGRATIKVHVSDVGDGMPASVKLEARHYNTNTQCSGLTYEVIKVTGITLNTNSISLPMGNTRQLTATVTPNDATNKTVTWSSSDPAVATVSNTGLVTGVTVGSATITATASNGLTATCSVTVTPIALNSVTLPAVQTVFVGSAPIQLTPTYNPANASIQTVTWSSSAPTIAAVGDDGTVTGIALGTANITVTATDYSGNTRTATCAVTVTRNRVTVTLSANGVSDGNNYTQRTLTSGIVTATFSNARRRGTYVQFYNNITFTTTGNKNIVGVVVNYSQDFASSPSANSGTYTRNSNTKGTWTGSTTSLQFEYGSNYYRYISSIEVTYEE